MELNDLARLVPSVLEWSGCITALIGSALLALGSKKMAGYGFCLFLVSNCFWIAFAMMIGSKGLLVMQLGFTITSCMGIYRWIFAGLQRPAETVFEQGTTI